MCRQYAMLPVKTRRSILGQKNRQAMAFLLCPRETRGHGTRAMMGFGWSLGVNEASRGMFVPVLEMLACLGERGGVLAKKSSSGREADVLTAAAAID